MRRTKFCIEWIALIYQYFFRFWIIGSLVSVQILFGCIYVHCVNQCVIHYYIILHLLSSLDFILFFLLLFWFFLLLFWFFLLIFLLFLLLLFLSVKLIIIKTYFYLVILAILMIDYTILTLLLKCPIICSFKMVTRKLAQPHEGKSSVA